MCVFRGVTVLQMHRFDGSLGEGNEYVITDDYSFQDGTVKCCVMVDVNNSSSGFNFSEK